MVDSQKNYDDVIRVSFGRFLEHLSYENNHIIAARFISLISSIYFQLYRQYSTN